MNSLLDYVKKVNESVKKNDEKFDIDTISSKIKEAIKTPISVRCNSASSMTTAMQKMFKRMGLKNTVEVTRSLIDSRIYYHFSVDGSEVLRHKVHSMDGNMGKFDFFRCVNDCICYAIIKNEKLTGKDKQAVENMFDTSNYTDPDWNNLYSESSKIK